MSGSSNAFREPIAQLYQVGVSQSKPTPIPIPVNPRQSRSFVNPNKNPYTQSSLHNNLHDKQRPNGIGNRRNAVATTNTVPARGVPRVSNAFNLQLGPFTARPGHSRPGFEGSGPSTPKMPAHYDGHVDGSIDHGSHGPHPRRNPISVTPQHDDLDPDLDTSEDPMLLQPGDTLTGSSPSSKQRDSAQSAQPRPAVQEDFGLLISQSSRPVDDRRLAPSKRQASQFLDSQHQRKKPRSNLLVQGELSDDHIQVPGPSPKDNIPTINFTSKKERMKGRKVAAETPNRSSSTRSGRDNIGTAHPDLFLPIQKLHWGGKILYEDDEPNHDQITWLVMNSAPTLQLCSDRAWNDGKRLAGKVDLMIPLKTIKMVEYVTEDPPNYLQILVNKPSEITPGSHPLVKSGWLEPGGTVLSSIGFELDLQSARWDVEASPRRYRRIIDRLKVYGCGSSVLRPSGIESLKKFKRNYVTEYEDALDKVKKMRNSGARSVRSINIRESSSPEISLGQEPIPTRRRISSRLRNEDVRTKSPPPNANELLLVYPPTGTGAVNITVGDYRRLDPGEFFNDTLIEFGLKLAFNKLKASQPQLAEEIHIFNSFFYKKLSSKSSTDGYQSVRKWTTKFKLFEKKFLIVPINENFHWYLAIIYNPGSVLPPDPLPLSLPKANSQPTRTTRSSTTGPALQQRMIANEDTSVEGSDEAKSVSEPDSKAAETVGDNSPASDAQSIEEMVISASQVTLGSEDVAPHDNHSASTSVPLAPSHAPVEEDRQVFSLDDSMEVDVLPAPESTTGHGSVKAPSIIDVDEEMLDGTAPGEDTIGDKPRVPSTQGKDISKAHIFILDSLGSSEHREPRKILGDYLLKEAHDKDLITPTAFADPAVKSWFKNHVAGHNVKVPLQPNHCDCGVYLVHFAETFLDNPEDIVREMSSGRRSTREYQSLLWKKKELNQKRASIKEKIDILTEEWRKLQGLPTTTQLPSQSQPMPASSGVNDAPPADEAAVPIMNAVDGSPRPSTPVAVISHIKDAEEVEGMLRPRSPTLSDKYQIRQGAAPPSHNPFSIDNDSEPVRDPPDSRVLRSKPLSASSAIISKQISTESPRPRVFIAGSRANSSPKAEKPNSRGSGRRPRPELLSATTPQMTAQGSISTTSERRSSRTNPIYVQDDDDPAGEAAATSSKQQEGREVKTRENDIIIPETEDEAESVDDDATVDDIVPPYAVNRAPVFPSLFRRTSNVRPSAPSLLDGEDDITSISGKRDLPAKKTAIEGPSARLRG